MTTTRDFRGEKKSEQQHETTRTAFSVLSLNELALTDAPIEFCSSFSSSCSRNSRNDCFVVSAAPADVKEDAISIIRLNWKKV